MKATIKVQLHSLFTIKNRIIELSKFFLSKKEKQKWNVNQDLSILTNQLSEYLEQTDIRQSDWPLQQGMVELLDVALLEKVKMGTSAPQEVSELAEQLKIICVFLRTDILDVVVYEYLNCLEILAGTRKDFDRPSFLLSLRELKDDKYGHEIAWQASDPATWLLNSPENPSWFDVAVRTVLLHITFKWFWMMPEERQKNLLTNYFWQAAQAGVPLRENLGEPLYQTQSVAQFAIENERLIGLLEGNTEEILYGEENEKLGSFLDIARAFYNKVNDPSTVEEQAALYVQSMCPLELKDTAFPEQLAEALSVYVRLKEAILIDHNMAGEPEGQNQFNFELAQLVIWFTNEADWNKMADYFKNEQSLVSWKQFFRQYVGNIDLQTDTEAVTKLLNFNEFLQKNGLTPEDFAPISFHESDSQFHWNEEFLS